MSGCRFQRKYRQPRGSILILTVGLLIVITGVLIYFLLDFVQLLGSHQEQMTAIEAAALAAAKDLGQIVIEDPNLGFIALSDYAPNGKATKAQDNYYLPVRSINTLLATVRLDMIIAEALDDNIMRAFAKRDYDFTRAAAVRLAAALNDAVAPSGSGKDKDDNIVRPVEDAIDAYNANQVRIARGKSTLLPSTLELRLGVVEPVETNTRIPQPPQFAEIAADKQSREFYMAFTNIPYKDSPFVFSAVGDAVTLVDGKQFKETPSGLPFFVPSIISCEADQEYVSKDQFGNPSRRVVHAKAWAQAAAAPDKRPAPGAFSVSLPSGSIPDIDSLFLMYTNDMLSKPPADETVTARNNDSPPASLSICTLPILNEARPPIGQLMRLALYDWIKRNGPNLNVQSMLTAFSAKFPYSPAPHRILLECDVNGMVTMRSQPISANYALATSHNQWSAISGLAYKSGVNVYDLFIKDYVFQAGRQLGGMHAGEPLGPPAVGPAIAGGALSKSLGENSPVSIAFPTGSAGGGERPTYQQSGIAVDLKLEKRLP